MVIDKSKRQPMAVLDLRTDNLPAPFVRMASDMLGQKLQIPALTL